MRSRAAIFNFGNSEGHRRRVQFAAYAVAIVGVALAAWTRWQLQNIFGPGQGIYTLFYIPVAAAALLGGLWPGALATALSALAVAWTVLERDGNWVLQPGTWVGMGLFLLVGLGLSIAAEALYRFRHYLAETISDSELLNALLEGTDDMVAAADRDFRYLRFNRAYREAFQKLFGVRPRVGDCILDLVKDSKVDLDYVKRAGARAFRGEVFTDVTDLGLSDRYYQISFGPIRDITGRLIGASHIVRDVTGQRRNLERRQFLSQVVADLLAARDLNAVLNNLLLGASRLLQAQVYFHYTFEADNKLHLRLCGGLDETLRQSYERLELGEHLCGLAAQQRSPLYRERLMDEDSEVGAAARLAGVKAFATLPLMAGDRLLGTIAFGSRDRDAYDSHDKNFLDFVARYVSIAVDRKQSRRRLEQAERDFRLLAENMSQLAWMTEPDGSIFWYNKRWIEFTGKTLEQMREQGWRVVHHSGHFPRVDETWSNSLRTGKPWEETFPLLGRDGNYRWFLSRAVPIRDEQGKVWRWFGTNTDVTEQLHTQEQLCQARDELARLNELLEQQKAELERQVQARTAELRKTLGDLEHFSYSLVHDMRAPLRAMSGFSSMLLKECADCLNPLRFDMLKRIASAADRMDQLVVDALDYSKVIRQKMSLDPIDTDTLVRGIIDTYPDFQPPKSHVVVEGTLPQVMANQAGITQCFSNLLHNAVKFVKPGQVPEVRIWAEAHGANVRFCVQDKGIGIPSDLHDRIFEMFQRVSKEYEGTGIGLALVRKVVEKMNGTVGVESEPGHGSKFWIELRKAGAEEVPMAA